MKIKRNDVYLELTEIHPREFELLLSTLNTVYSLMDSVRLDSEIDNQEKARCKDDLLEIIDVFNQERGSQTAVSRNEQIILKVLEKNSDRV